MKFAFVSGHPALDFAGTVQHRRSDANDLLATPEDLSAWAAASDLVDTPEPADAAGLAQAVRLREAIYRLAYARSVGSPYDPADCALLTGEAAGARIRLELLPDGTLRRAGSVQAVLATLASSAVELLAAPPALVIKECTAEPCTRLYLDRSRRGSRRWCDMGGCGNRAKAAKFRERHAP
ncbi:ABATE domain-containing protein [Microbispora sp. RL4-1S]|uniref:ABATE domain-containing protein n=1 Tax=Microbispora oryzae TaxID=2806554 RepID=A0A940WN84_9ACTN|nr:ABATE domain-containing protein [Microbispora oryzae]MBP2704136.1 ABATE domain-containing protein [Microbispora oryzae]